MTSKAEILTKLQYQLGIEVMAEQTYQMAKEKISDPKIKDTLNKIISQEREHTAAVKQMIALVQGISEIGAGTQPSPPEPFDLPDDVDTLLFELELGEFSHKTIHLVKSLIGSRKIVYVSYNKLPKYIKSKFEDAGIAKDKISFLNCTKSDTGVDVHASPESLTEISYTIKDQNTPDVKTVVVVDAVNRFITYFEESELLSFLGSLNDDAREKHYQIIWLLVSGDLPKSFSTKVAQLCDEYRVG